MESISEVFKIVKDIDAAVSNFKKDGPSRKTKTYFEKRKEHLAELVCKLDSADEAIKAQGIQTTSDYSTTFGKATQLAEWYLNTLNDGLRQLVEYGNQHPEGDINTVSLATLKLSNEQKILANQEETDNNGSSFFEEDDDNADENLRKLVKKQEGLLINLQHQLDNLKPGKDKDNEKVEFRIERLKKTFDKVEDVDMQIWAIAQATKAYGYDHELFFTFADKVETTVTQCGKTTLKKTSDSEIRLLRPKLPEISCPVFDGDYRQWYAFTELFKALIHNRTDIGLVEKMVYLQRNLSGEALGLVKNLALTENNYEAALKLLSDRYSNTRLIINAHLETMLDRPNLGQQSAKGLKGMHDDIKEALQALNRMKVNTSSWDPILHFLITRKLDNRTRILYETQLDDVKTVPSIDTLLAFMHSQFNALEALGKRGDKEESNGKKNSLVVTVSSCVLDCGENHAIHLCGKFKGLKVAERYEVVKSKNLCLNCLRPGHRVRDCKSRSCKHCESKHNSMLHFEKNPIQSSEQAANSSELIIEEPSSVNALLASFDNHVILATVMIAVKHSNSNRTIICRAILDSGSQVSFVTSSIVKKLGVKGSSANIEVEGIGNSKKGSTLKTNLNISSTSTNFSIDLKNVLVLDSITSKHPSCDINPTEFRIPGNVQLADPEFHKSRDIGVLLGADIVGKVLEAGNMYLGKGKPSLQNTLFGWVVIGEVLVNSPNTYFCGIVTSNENKYEIGDSAVIKKYWEQENGDSFSKNRKTANRLCEQKFFQTTQRDEKGRFIVNLPFVKDVKLLGSSEAMAFKRFISMERKLLAHQEIQRQYCEFMKNYLALGHMEEVRRNELKGRNKSYLPHHYVLKPSSTTTKLRVVFDAAARTTSNMSVNDLLPAGPKLQPDLFNIMLRFRAFKYVLSGDIEMMYRQINVHPSDQYYQLIFWRFNPNDRIKTYKLKTVTYGTTCAPYLAVKCMQSLAIQFANQFPLASQTIMNDFYMDDLITGSDDLDELNRTKTEVIRILEGGGFHLRKWSTNNKFLLNDIPSADWETKFDAKVESVKILGIHWKADDDVFHIKVKHSNEISNQLVTKRFVLTKIAEIFDPLGIISPILVVGKLLLQELWSLKLDWDEPLEDDMVKRWTSFSSQLFLLNELVIPRMIGSGEIESSIELHGFCDASKAAYGAVIYSRYIHNSNVFVNMVCSKSRVVSLSKKNTAREVSIPRLELNAAVLLSELMSVVVKTLPKKPIYVQYYTDSSTVLHWIHKCSETLVPYVARRVSVVQNITNISDWRYVASKNNPADIVSRGQSPSKFVKNLVWFNGPKFLSAQVLQYDSFSAQSLLGLELENADKNKVALVVNEPKLQLLGIDTRNSFEFLLGVMTIVIKFIYKRCNRNLPVDFTWKKLAMHTILRDMQDEFEQERIDLKSGKIVDSQSKLKTLSPFIDKNGLIRVGGRITKAAQIPFDARHPIVISNKHFATYLLVKSIHQRHLHTGAQALLYIIRQNYWPIRGRTITKRVVNNCYRCFKCRPRNLEQIMGNLPSDRLKFQRPFMVCGIDYIGPIKIHHNVRGKKPTKAYICVFICFATKAVHIEVVSDLSTNAFIAAFKRMIGRRGCPIRVYSDNGSNFKGAAREIEETITSSEFKKELNLRNIEWKFIPARSPHMGGLWEAAVRSIKGHFERVVQNYSLNFEELQTLMIEIEAILNSRPLTPLSEDPNDLQVLSPGHFLIGEPLSSLPERNVEISRSFRHNWEALISLKREFWCRWTKEYLSELQKRSKWNDPKENIEIGSLVLLKDNDLPTLSWRRARVISCIKGDDNRVRVVELKTSTGVTKRSVHLVAPFPKAIQHGLVEDYGEPVVSKDDGNNSDLAEFAGQPSESVNSKNNENNERISVQENISLMSRTTLVSRNCNIKHLLLLVMLFIPLAVSNSIFRPIDDKSVLFFEELGKSKIILTNFKLIAFYNLDSYWSARRGIRETVNQLSVTCQTSGEEMRNHTSCENITTQLKRKLDKFEKLHNFIFHNPRQKRAVLKIVGAILHDITGILDEDTANEYSQQIQENKENQQKMVTMFKGLAALHNSTMNIMEENNEVIVKELGLIRFNISSMSSALDCFSFDVMITKTLLAIEEFQLFQQSIWESIRDVHSGVFNPQIIDPNQLEVVVTNMRSQLPPSMSFPETNTFELFKLFKVKCSSTLDNIIFEIQIPLVGTEGYSMFQIHSFPTIFEDKLIVVHPKIKYLLVNEMQDRYLEVRDDKQCIKTESDWFCLGLNEVFHIKNTKSCEISLFLGNDKDSLTYCEFSIQHEHEIITSLTTRNNWLVIEPQEQVFDIVCDHKRFKEIIKGRGTFKIQPGCQVKTSISTIAAYEQETKNITFTTADVDWNLILANSTKRDLEYDGRFELQLLELQKLPRAPAESAFDLPVRELHQFAVSYTSLILIVIVGIVIIYAILKFRSNINKHIIRIPLTNKQLDIETPIFENEAVL